jgi:OOP family OmpA-OmpF porin
MMKNVKCLTRILVPVALMCATSIASAADSGFYVGLSLGEAKYDIPEGPSGLFPITTTSYSSDSDSTVGVTAGYRFNPYLGVELSYLDLGSYKFSETGRSSAPASGALDIEASAKGVALAVTGAFPIGNFDIHAKLGGMQAKTEVSAVVRSVTLSQVSASDSASTFETLYGVGVGYSAGAHCNFSLDWTSIPKVGDENDTGETDVSVVSFGFAYRF